MHKFEWKPKKSGDLSAFVQVIFLSQECRER